MPPVLHRLRLVNSRQLCALEVAKPLPDFRESEAGEFLGERVMPTSLIDDDKAIAPAAIRQHQPMCRERHLERRASLFERCRQSEIVLRMCPRSVPSRRASSNSLRSAARVLESGARSPLTIFKPNFFSSSRDSSFSFRL